MRYLIVKHTYIGEYSEDVLNVIAEKTPEAIVDIEPALISWYSNAASESGYNLVPLPDCVTLVNLKERWLASAIKQKEAYGKREAIQAERNRLAIAKRKETKAKNELEKKQKLLEKLKAELEP